MRLLIVRNGQSEADLLGRHEGRADYPLSELGMMQAEKLAFYLAQHFNITHLISSPLNRARQTAEYISKQSNIPCIIEPLVTDMDNGKLAGLTYEEADRLYPLPNEGTNLYTPKPGGESLIEFRSRVELFWHRFHHEHSSEINDHIICIVTHGGTINMLYQSILGLPFNTNFVFPTSDTGFHELTIEDGRVVLIRGNCENHLL